MNHCLHCGIETTNPKYCSRSCSAKATNKVHSKESRERQKHKTSKTLLAKRVISGPYTKVYLCKCKYTNKLWYSKTVKHVHPSTIETKEQYSYQCKFNFSFSQYPEWFPNVGDLITKFGFYQTKDKTKTNLKGLSRDHLYSVSEGFKHNVDPKILAHPANCSLITQSDNQRKHKKCSITLDELLIRIEKFNTLYGRPIR